MGLVRWGTGIVNKIDMTICRYIGFGKDEHGMYFYVMDCWFFYNKNTVSMLKTGGKPIYKSYEFKYKKRGVGK